VLRSYTESLSEPAVARTLVELLPEEAQLVVSSSMPIRDLDAYAPAGTRHLRVFSNRGVNGIDGVVSTALGVASGAVRPTALLIGDVAALHDLSGWLLSRNVGVPLVAIVINNDGGGIFNFLPVAERTPHFERFFATAHSMDFALVAKLAGAAYECPSTLGQFAKVVSESFDRAGLHLIEVRTERRANVDFHRTLNAACTAAVEAV
jgi:2-succinyl-5-enolpyruvyl-6-hydroxy-3-cyclohexene-1-carboxylate synthase